MGFLDNSGDIILDAVLTDHGRKLLAKGDGSFRIAKYALGDEEINYALYNSNHTSGSAYYDLEILQTPVLESFTNNTSTMKTKLITLADQNLLYLPVLKINQNLVNTQMHSSGAYVIAVDANTEGTDAAGITGSVGYNNTTQRQGILFGESFKDSNYIKIDQGLDTTEISPGQRSAMGNLIETSYIVQMDNRLGRLTDINGSVVAEDYIDDDNIAFYTIDSSDNVVTDILDDSTSAEQTIAGPRGTTVQFKVGASLDLNTSTYLFEQLGGESVLPNKSNTGQPVRHIDSMVRLTGMSTGYSIDIPIRYVKIRI